MSFSRIVPLQAETLDHVDSEIRAPLVLKRSRLANTVAQLEARGHGIEAKRSQQVQVTS